MVFPVPDYKCSPVRSPRPKYHDLNHFSVMPSLQSQSYVFDARPRYPLLVSVKRYWVPGFESTDADAATLILAHATSFHKEIWEPFLEDLYGLVAVASRGNAALPKIRDVWAIDCPNHGDSAILNEETLLSGYTPICEFHLWPYQGVYSIPYSHVGGIRASTSPHPERFWQRHRCELQVPEPSRGGPLYGGSGHVSPCTLRFCYSDTHLLLL